MVVMRNLDPVKLNDKKSRPSVKIFRVPKTWHIIIPKKVNWVDKKFRH